MAISSTKRGRAVVMGFQIVGLAAVFSSAAGCGVLSESARDSSMGDRDETVVAAVAGRHVRIFAVSESAIRVTDTIALPKTAVQVIWRNANQLVILFEDLEDRDAAVHYSAALLHDGELEWLTVPKKSDWPVPNGPFGTEEFFSKPTLKRNEHGQVSLGMCVWGYYGDDDPCVIWSYVSLLDAQPVTITEHKWRAAAPDGYSLLLKDGELVCVSKDESMVSVAYHLNVERAYWVSEQPPLFVVHAVPPGEGWETTTEELIFSACDDAPRIQVGLRHVELGPSPYWMHSDSNDDWIVWYRGRKLGRLDRVRSAPGEADAFMWAAFRPAT